MKISVIIPVYNSEKYLVKCLDSVLAQTYDNWEVIALDDGSKDNSFSILEKYAQEDSRFYVETKENEGPGLTRNRALDKATGDFIVFIDSDDYIENNYFELLVKKHKETGAEVIFIDVLQENINGKILRHEKMSKFKKLSREDMIGCQMTGYMPWGGVRKAVSRALIKKNTIRYSDDAVGEEAIYSFDLLRNAEKICFIEEYLYHYVNHEGSQSKNTNYSWDIVISKMEKHLKEKRVSKKYEIHISSLAYIVMLILLIRFAKYNSLCNTCQYGKILLKEFKTKYDWKINKCYLRPAARILIPLLKAGLVMPVAIAAKIY